MAEVYIVVEIIVRNQEEEELLKGMDLPHLSFREVKDHRYDDGWYKRAVCYRAIVNCFSTSFFGTDLTMLAKEGFEMRVYSL